MSVARSPLMAVVLSIALLTALGVQPAAAQWTQGRAGRVWVKVAGFFQQTDEKFGAFGEREPWINNGESNSRAIFTDIIVGVHPSVDVWVQVPYFDLRFDRPSVNEISSTGVGDIRGWVRWNFLSLGNGSTPLAVRIGAKAPVGHSPLDGEIVPLGEGQWDFEMFGEIGHSFWPAPVYAEVWLGYRQRFERADPDKPQKNPGEEIVYLVEAGVQPTPDALVKLTVDGFEGDRWVREGLRVNFERRITTMQFAVAIRTGPLWPEIGVRVPVSGQQFPAGPQFVIAVSAQLIK